MSRGGRLGEIEGHVRKLNWEPFTIPHVGSVGAQVSNTTINTGVVFHVKTDAGSGIRGAVTDNNSS